MEIAVNIADLTRYDQIVLSCMVAPVIQTQRRVTPPSERGRIDGGCVVLDCDYERARSIVEFLRNLDDKRKQYRLRAYEQGSRKGWRKI
jgi:hypothetical protein